MSSFSVCPKEAKKFSIVHYFPYAIFYVIDSIAFAIYLPHRAHDDSAPSRRLQLRRIPSSFPMYRPVFISLLPLCSCQEESLLGYIQVYNTFQTAQPVVFVLSLEPFDFGLL